MGRNMITIHYLGNEFVKEDSLAIELADTLKNKFKDVKFKKIDNFEDMITIKDKYYFMDVCEGISKARLINDIAVFENIRTITSHDIDFGFFLKLNDKLGEINKVNIICIPQQSYKELEKDVGDIITKLLGEIQ